MQHRTRRRVAQTGAPTTPTAPTTDPQALNRSLRVVGALPDRFDLATVVGRTNPRSGALLAAPAEDGAR